jgi:hypothetical protein
MVLVPVFAFTGDVQRNRTFKSEQGVNFFLTKRFIFIFISFLGFFVSFPFQRNIVSFHELEIYFPFRFVSENYAFLAFRSVSFRS